MLYGSMEIDVGHIMLNFLFNILYTLLCQTVLLFNLVNGLPQICSDFVPFQLHGHEASVRR
jgi:hypothetical protein